MVINQDVTNALISLLSVVITAVLTFITAKVNEYLKGVKNQQLQDAFTGAFAAIEKTAENAVLNVKQTLTDDLKADGKLTPEEAGKALEAAKEYFYANVSAELLKIVEKELGEAEGWIAGLLEARLGAVKK